MPGYTLLFEDYNIDMLPQDSKWAKYSSWCDLNSPSRWNWPARARASANRLRCVGGSPALGLAIRQNPTEDPASRPSSRVHLAGEWPVTKWDDPPRLCLQSPFYPKQAYLDRVHPSDLSWWFQGFKSSVCSPYCALETHSFNSPQSENSIELVRGNIYMQEKLFTWRLKPWFPVGFPNKINQSTQHTTGSAVALVSMLRDMVHHEDWGISSLDGWTCAWRLRVPGIETTFPELKGKSVGYPSRC